MKNIIVASIVAVTISLTACEDNAINPFNQETAGVDFATSGDEANLRGQRPQLDSVNVDDLSTSITDYISANYAGMEIIKAGTDDEGNFIVLVKGDERPQALLFDASGAFVEELKRPKGKGNGPGKGNRPQLDSVGVDDLSSTITDYISANYADMEIMRAGTDEDGNFIVLVKGDERPQALLFDATGTFVKELQKPKGGKGQGNGQRPELTEVEVGDLSSTITDYISANYAEMEIIKAGTNPEGDFIVVVKGDDKPVAILFNTDGEFQKELQRMKRRGGPQQ